MLEELQKIYTDVSEWLKFIETKHAAVFAVWTAMLIAVLSIDAFWDLELYKMILILIPLFVGIIINLLAFMPFLNRWTCLKEHCYKIYDNNQSMCNNRVFYQSIFVQTYVSGQGTDAAVVKYKNLFQSSSDSFWQEVLAEDYMRQIVEVSTVATIKVYLFGISVKYLFGILVLIMAGLIIA